MKRLILLASLCVVGFVVAPIASASAETLTGSCTIEGTATFTNLLGKTPEPNGYSFVGTAECKNTEGKTLKGTAEVSGKGELACAVSKGGVVVAGEAAGPGKLTLEGKEFPFELSFVAAGGNVALVVNDSAGKATGDAEFLTPAATKSETLTKCAKGELKSLEFVAAAAGTI